MGRGGEEGSRIHHTMVEAESFQDDMREGATPTDNNQQHQPRDLMPGRVCCVLMGIIYIYIYVYMMCMRCII